MRSLRRQSQPGRTLAAFPALALAAFLPACDMAGASGGTLEDLAPLAIAEDRRLGDFDDPDVGFSQVFALEVGDDGLVYVTEASVPEIRVYDAEGRVVRRIGRRGEGPGEFQFPASSGVVGDTVWTWDSRLRRITLFDREGRVLSTARVEPVQVALPAGYASVLPWRMRPPSEDDFRMEFVHVGEQRYMVPNPPTTLPFWESPHDGYILVETPVATSAEPPNVDQVTRALRTAMDFPDFQLPVVATWLAQDETLWLRLTGGADGEPVGWVLIDPAGQPRGRLEMPPLVRPLWAQSDTVWVVEPGEFDVPWVVRYQLEEG